MNARSMFDTDAPTGTVAEVRLGGGHQGPAGAAVSAAHAPGAANAAQKRRTWVRPPQDEAHVRRFGVAGTQRAARAAAGAECAEIGGPARLWADFRPFDAPR
jgi:hypothetical protein